MSLRLGKKWLGSAFCREHTLSAFFSAWRKVVTVAILSGWASSAGEIRKGPVSASCLQIVRKLHEITGVQHRQHSMGVSQLTTKSAGNWITANKNPTIDWDPSPRFAAHLCSGVFCSREAFFFEGTWWTSHTLSCSSIFNPFPYLTAFSFIVCFISIADFS